jgi:hypothetical protein
MNPSPSNRNHLPDFDFLGFDCGGVASILRKASSNVTPLRFSGGVGIGRFTIFLFLGTVALSSPTIGQVPLLRYHFLEAGNPPKSDCLFVGQPFSLGDLDRFEHPHSVRDLAMVPAKGKFTGILGQVFAAHMMPRTMHAALEQAEE